MIFEYFIYKYNYKMLTDPGRFDFYLRIYCNDLIILAAWRKAPDVFPHIHVAELIWELDMSWRHLEQMIPDEILTELGVFP